MDYTVREKSLLTGKNTLELLYSLKNFPVFIGCTEEALRSDLRADMIFDICKETGFIQLRNLLPLDIVYGQYHSEAVGGVWKEHHQQFAKFINSSGPHSILEVGGSNGNLAKETLNNNAEIKWTIVEPAPSIESNSSFRVIKGYFDDNFILDFSIDTVINSHVLEHLYNPESMIRHINRILPNEGKFIFSIPNLSKWLKNKFPNTLNFEHTVFLTEDFLDFILKRNNFKIIKKDYFQEHSIFYYTEKIKIIGPVEKPHKYEENKKMYLDFINYYKEETEKLNIQFNNFEEVYLFGAHIFSQFFLAFGLKEEKIKGILDNSQLKQSKRLYGSKLKIFSPELIKGKNGVAVILRAGAYNNEISRQLKDLNSQVVIL